MANIDVSILLTAKDQASSVLKKFGSNMGGMASASKTVAIGLLGVGAAAVGFGAMAVNAAAGAEVQMARFNSTMKSAGDKSGKAAKQILGFADSFVQLGFDDEDAAESMAKFFQRTKDVTEAQKLTALAADLARAKNIDLSSATKLVNMTLSGGAKALKEYGIEIKDSATPLEALGKLQDAVGGQADAFAGTFSGQLATVQKTFGNLMEEIGAKLLPILTPILTKIAEFAKMLIDKGVPALSKFFGFLGDHKEILIAFAAFIAAILIPAFISWGVAAGTAAIATLTALAPLLAVGAAVAAVAFLIAKAWNSNFLGIQEKVKAVVGWFTNTALPFIQKFWNSIKTAGQTAWKFITTLDFGKLVSGIPKAIGNAIIGLIEGAIKGALGAVPLFKKLAASINFPRFEQGGIVGGRTGQAQLAVVHGGEEVIPAGRRGGVSQTINIDNLNLGGMMDVDAFSERMAFRARNSGLL